MRLHKNRRENTTTLSLDVRKIEVTRLTWELDDRGVYETYHRTIRSTVAGGEVLEVLCSARFEDEIQLHSVKKLTAVKPSKPSKPTDWLQPKVYKGKSMHEEELEHVS
jgi:hypothetical protein